MSNMYVATIAMMVIRWVVFTGIVLLITFVMISRKNNSRSGLTKSSSNGYESPNSSINRDDYVATLDMIERMLRDGSSKESIIDYIEGKKRN